MLGDDDGTVVEVIVTEDPSIDVSCDGKCGRFATHIVSVIHRTVPKRVKIHLLCEICIGT